MGRAESSGAKHGVNTRTKKKKGKREKGPGGNSGVSQNVTECGHK